jgi:alpha-glucosidase
MLLLTLRGTPTMYYGDEIGMHDVRISPERVRDPYERNVPGRGRDPERTPMQWDATAGAGFSVGVPWLPVSDDAPLVNVARQERDSTSMLALYRRLISLRRAEAALTIGEYRPLEADGDTMAYVREDAGRRLLVALNLGPRPAVLSLGRECGRVLLTTHLDRESEPVRGTMALRPDEGLLCGLG